MHMQAAALPFPKWQTSIMLGLAKSMRIPHDQFPDIVQELALEWQRFYETRFDKTRADADERTLFYAVATRYLKKRCRQFCREQDMLKRLGTPDAVYEPDLSDELREDVTTVVSMLRDDDRRICQLLSEGHSRHRVAEELGVDWHTVMAAVRRIRKLFERHGLQHYIGA